MSKWVQHISGQGEKWEVRECAYNKDGHADWCVESQHGGHGIEQWHYLPKSEFRECDPPERWRDVTAELEEGSTRSWGEAEAKQYAVRAFDPYRLRKIEMGSGQQVFIVEKKEG
jgi:hypothetical protein